jgi:hypothetical protein
MLAQEAEKPATAATVNGLPMVEQLGDPLHPIATAKNSSPRPKCLDRGRLWGAAAGVVDPAKAEIESWLRDQLYEAVDAAFTIADFGAWTHVGHPLTYDLINRGDLIAVKVGGETLILKAGKWLASLPPIDARPRKQEAV